MLILHLFRGLHASNSINDCKMEAPRSSNRHLLPASDSAVSSNPLVFFTKKGQQLNLRRISWNLDVVRTTCLAAPKSWQGHVREWYMVNGYVFMGHKPHQLQGKAPSVYNVKKIHLCPGRGSINVAWVDQFDWVLSFTSHHSETGFCGTVMLSQHMLCIAVFFFF